MQKLWQKPYELDARIERFTVGRDRELDLLLAPYDIAGSLAHAKMLASVGLLEEVELAQLEPALKRLYQQAVRGEFRITDGVEDVHSQVELLLTEELGDVGKKIHSGRSRNDQVLVDLRLFFRAELAELVRTTASFSEQLIELSEAHAEVLLPGYTHLQVAMVSSFGLWFGAYAETLVDDLRLFQGVYRIVNQNPLGSAAGYGSSFPLDRRLTTELLGFDDVAYNVVHAQMGRGKTELQVAFALANLGATLGKMAMDVCLYNSQNFGFLELPDDLTTGSSIMPHKKNPDVFELLRGRANQLQSLPAQVSQLTGNLPSGYHRDFQLLKEVVFPGLEAAKDCLDIAAYACAHLKVKKDLLADPKYDPLYSVEVVNREVLNGLPFRDAYHKVSSQIAEGAFTPSRKLDHTHLGSLGNLANDDIQRKLEAVLQDFNLERAERAVEGLVG
jgi:argininosuccinate lyase